MFKIFEELISEDQCNLVEWLIQNNAKNLRKKTKKAEKKKIYLSKVFCIICKKCRQRKSFPNVIKEGEAVCLDCQIKIKKSRQGKRSIEEKLKLKKKAIILFKNGYSFFKISKILKISYYLARKWCNEKV